MPSALERALRQYSAALARHEQLATGRMLAAWASAWQQVRAASEALALRIAAGEANQVGLQTRQAWLEDYRRMVAGEVQRLLAAAAPETAALQNAAVTAALEDAAHLTELAAGADGAAVRALLRRPNANAVRALVGVAGNGSPLADVLAEVAGGHAERMALRLADGVARGLNPRVVARWLRAEFGAPAYRALLIARTESQRAYRTATMESYRANDDLLEGWLWICACQPTTCAACWMMHGSLHALSEDLDEHPGGACKAAPQLRGAPLSIASGAERLTAAGEDVQQRVLGAARFAAWQDGAFELADLVGRRQSDAWGASISVRPLAALVGAEQATAYASAARAAQQAAA